jgi:hypothetical protein
MKPLFARAERFATLILVLILIVAGAAIVTGMRKTSTTFDEIVLVAGGARGYHIGKFDFARDHPPLMQYVYGLPVALSGAKLPDESQWSSEVRAAPGYRYQYAATLYWGVGNDPERIAFLGRLPAVLIALGLVVLTYGFTRRHWGPRAALIAAALVAFLPDVLAHGGVAYNDLPVTFAFFAAAWAIDEAIRAPSVPRALLAGALCGLAIGVKISAAALAPLAFALVIAEAAARRVRGLPFKEENRANWWLRIAGVAAAALFASYLALALIYGGDFKLEGFRYGLEFRYQHMRGGHGAPAFLLGRKSTTGWWYFFPVAFLFKTSAGLHVLLVMAFVKLVTLAFRAPARILSSPLRVPILGILFVGGALVSSNLNIGFRYAMPVLPMICVVTAVGVYPIWQGRSRVARIVIAAALVWAVGFPLTYHPHYLAFISEYGPARNLNHTVLIDSSLDWGQGLLELRDFMKEQKIPQIYLSYFGSAEPAGYGIDYWPLASFFTLPEMPRDGTRPEFVVISATNLQGVYIGDRFARFRAVEPDTVLGHTIMVYRVTGGSN